MVFAAFLLCPFTRDVSSLVACIITYYQRQLTLKTELRLLTASQRYILDNYGQAEDGLESLR